MKCVSARETPDPPGRFRDSRKKVRIGPKSRSRVAPSAQRSAHSSRAPAVRYPTSGSGADHSLAAQRSPEV